MRAFTDYPIIELGDTPGVEAPVREVEVLHYDNNKYVEILVGGIKTTVKWGYLYTKPGRLDDVPTVDVTNLPGYRKRRR